MLRHILILLAISAVTLAATNREDLEEKPEEYKDSDGCWVSEIDTFIPIGGSEPNPTECEVYRCTETYVEIESCDPIGARVAYPCHITWNQSLPYPSCCKWWVTCETTE